MLYKGGQNMYIYIAS